MRLLVCAVLVSRLFLYQGYKRRIQSQLSAICTTGQADVQMNMMPDHAAEIRFRCITRCFTERSAGKITLQWEKRDSYNQRQGAVLLKDSISLTNGPVESSLRFRKLDKPWLLVATIVNLDNNRKKWYLFKQD